MSFNDYNSSHVAISTSLPYDERGGGGGGASAGGVPSIGTGTSATSNGISASFRGGEASHYNNRHHQHHSNSAPPHRHLHALHSHPNLTHLPASLLSRLGPFDPSSSHTMAPTRHNTLNSNNNNIASSHHPRNRHGSGSKHRSKPSRRRSRGESAPLTTNPQTDLPQPSLLSSNASSITSSRRKHRSPPSQQHPRSSNDPQTTPPPQDRPTGPRDSTLNPKKSARSMNRHNQHHHHRHSRQGTPTKDDAGNPLHRRIADGTNRIQKKQSRPRSSLSKSNRPGSAPAASASVGGVPPPLSTSTTHPSMSSRPKKSGRQRINRNEYFKGLRLAARASKNANLASSTSNSLDLARDSYFALLGEAGHFLNPGSAIINREELLAQDDGLYRSETEDEEDYSGEEEMDHEIDDAFAGLDFDDEQGGDVDEDGNPRDESLSPMYSDEDDISGSELGDDDEGDEDAYEEDEVQGGPGEEDVELEEGEIIPTQEDVDAAAAAEAAATVASTESAQIAPLALPVIHLGNPTAATFNSSAQWYNQSSAPYTPSSHHPWQYSPWNPLTPNLPATPMVPTTPTTAILFNNKTSHRQSPTPFTAEYGSSPIPSYLSDDRSPILIHVLTPVLPSESPMIEGSAASQPGSAQQQHQHHTHVATCNRLPSHLHLRHSGGGGDADTSSTPSSPIAPLAAAAAVEV